MERFVCIHGHFYQPPRENPWIEAIEPQDSAYPYHDWNERITAESYAPNMASRILDGQGRIEQIVNNYAAISFDFGPTLLAWLEVSAPDVYRAVLDADRESIRRFSGHGSAMAQAYNHMIMPLANERDRRTQIRWGIRDFQLRFRRVPEGMWLPETAVDLGTLDLLAQEGIRFTVLAPHQAARVRRAGDAAWTEVEHASVDTMQAYRVNLPEGRQIAVFFYDGPISRSVAFEGLLDSGEGFASRLVNAFADAVARPQLLHIATDGETYGHHHRHGDMALGAALHHIEKTGLARLTNYGEYLEKYPPAFEAEIVENTSWSCAHGCERWRSDCGCNTGRPGLHQAWRAPLRGAMDWMRDTLAPIFEERGRQFLGDPWAARDDYVDVILGRSTENVDQFLAKHTTRSLASEERIAVLKLMEQQRHAMLAYTSCGWFFDDLGGIETVQVIQYAGRAIQLGQELFGDHLEEQFLQRLGQAESNLPEVGDGRDIYERHVRPAMVDLPKAAAHYAMSSLFEEYGLEARFYAFRADREDSQSAEVGRERLAVGRVRITSVVTEETGLFAFMVLHFGDHNMSAGIRLYAGPEAYANLVQEATGAFARADLAEAIRLLDRHFGSEVAYSLRSLFGDEQRKVLDIVLQSTLAEAEADLRQIYERHTPLMRFLSDLRAPLPPAFTATAGLVLNANLRDVVGADRPDATTVQALLKEVQTWQLSLDAEGIAFRLNRTIERLTDLWSADPLHADRLALLENAVAVARGMPFHVDLWKAQNVFYELLQSIYPVVLDRAKRDSDAGRWAERFQALGERLAVRLP